MIALMKALTFAVAAVKLLLEKFLLLLIIMTVNYDCDYDLSDQTEDTRVENALNESCGTEIFRDSSDPFCQQIPDHY